MWPGISDLGVDDGAKLPNHFVTDIEPWLTSKDLESANTGVFRAALKTTNCLGLVVPWVPRPCARGSSFAFQSLQEKIVQDCVLLSPDGVADALPGEVVTVVTCCMHKRKGLEHPMLDRHG